MSFIKFVPLLKSTLWGGNRLQSYKNYPQSMETVGESWELSGVPGNESVVSEGCYQGRTLSSLIDEMKEELVGKDNYLRFGNRFPLLIKFIDARQDLSIQVHPKDEMARMRHHCPGKNEMWYVIDAVPGARLCSGWLGKMTPDEYERRVADNTIEEVLRWHEVHPGDVFNIPAGRVHSIGAGILLAEIQQTSDITYRIYDYNRRDSNGNLRELHTELAKEAIDYSEVDNYRVQYVSSLNESVELLKTPYYRTSLYDLTEVTTCDYSNLDSFVIYICVSGKVTLRNENNDVFVISRGETILIPAKTNEVKLEPEGDVRLLECWV